MKLKMSEVNAQKPGNLHFVSNGKPWYTFQLFRTSMIFVIDGETVVSPPNSIILFNRESVQNFKSAESMMINDYVLFHPEDENVKDLVFDRPLSVLDPEFFHQILVMIYEEMYSANLLKNETCLHLMRVLLSKVREIYSLSNGQKRFYTAQDTRFINLRNDILAAPQKDWNVQDMANRCNLSPSRFQNIYKKMFRISPMADVIAARIVMSKALLQNTRFTIHTVAEKSGYSTESFFVRQFKSRVGITPTEYRKRRTEKRPS